MREDGSSNQRQAPFIQVNGAFVRKKESFSTTHGIMRAVIIFSNEQGE
jgi:sulfite reductase (NADPH) flavoprotein alpha-component